MILESHQRVRRNSNARQRYQENEQPKRDERSHGCTLEHLIKRRMHNQPMDVTLRLLVQDLKETILNEVADTVVNYVVIPSSHVPQATSPRAAPTGSQHTSTSFRNGTGILRVNRGEETSLHYVPFRIYPPRMRTLGVL